MPSRSLGWNRSGNATETSTLLPVHKSTKIDLEIASEDEKVAEKEAQIRDIRRGIPTNSFE